MAWTILYTRSAARSIRKLDPAVRRRVRAAIRILSESPERGKPLQLTLRGLRSWRTGDFRVVYRVIDEQIEILIVAVGNRRQARPARASHRSPPEATRPIPRWRSATLFANCSYYLPETKRVALLSSLFVSRPEQRFASSRCLFPSL